LGKANFTGIAINIGTAKEMAEMAIGAFETCALNLAESFSKEKVD
jgi:hypothetical protein